MSEWTPVLAVFWALWALDGVRLSPRPMFTFLGGSVRRARARVWFSRFTRPSWSPLAWRMTTPDVPLVLSPIGISNRPAGVAGRPGETPSRILAWRWEEIRDVGVARGWMFVNGERFCANTGHLTGRQLLALARLAPAQREPALRALLRRWLRPTHLARRARVLRARSAMAARFNAITFTGFAAVTVYVVADVPARLSAGWSTRVGDALPFFVLALIAMHFVAVVSAWRQMRRLKPVLPEKRAATLFSALLLPPQAMRLRATLAEGFFPSQHPLAPIVAFADAAPRADYCFNALADLRWPLGVDEAPPLAREIATSFREALGQELVPLLARAGVTAESLLAPPKADAPASCHYCPRCRGQFVAGPATCPHGVRLLPVRRN